MLMTSKLQKPIAIDMRPQMLKDFLRDDLNNSCSSSGFKSFPRKPNDSTIKNLVELDHRQTTNTLPRSRSRAAEATISALQKLLNAVKSSFPLNFAVDKSPSSPSSLTRNISLRLLKKGRQFFPAKEKFAVSDAKIVKVKVKDILRWKSFRDLIDEKEEMNANSQSLDSESTTAGSPSDGASTSGSGSKSWHSADSGFSLTEEDLPCPLKNPGDNKSWDVGGDSLEKATGNMYHAVGPEKITELGRSIKHQQGKVPIEEKEQHSPVSVLDSPFKEEEEEFSPSFEQSLANVERSKMRLLESIQWFESLAGVEHADLDEQFSLEKNTDSVKNEEEEYNGAGGKALRLMQHMRASGSKEQYGANLDQLLFDFFMQELTAKGKSRTDKKFEDTLEKEAKVYLRGHPIPLDCELQDMKERETCLEGVEREMQWSKFEEEQEELTLNMGITMLNALLDELLLELLEQR
ncbi:hypothetical protein Ancab_037786 [Ancistrocladus abbreviatus]